MKKLEHDGRTVHINQEWLVGIEVCRILARPPYKESATINIFMTSKIFTFKFESIEKANYWLEKNELI